MIPPSANRVDRFVRLLVGHQARLYQYVRMLLPDRESVDDVLQETFMVMWQKFDESYPDSSFFAWASRIAHLHVLRECRRSGRHVPALDPEILEQIACEEIAERESSPNLTSLLEGCLAKLPPADRELIEQRYQPGVLVGALAEQLGRPVNSVSKSLGRIRRALLKCVSDAAAAQAGSDSRRSP
jgi:RNA polymerase sigma-70 factor, ECF subfamily